MVARKDIGGRSMQGNCNCVNNKKELMEIISQASFALDDIILYLNTHPCDEKALKAYEEYRKIRKVAVMEYTKEYGPINSYDVEEGNYWDWVNSPWPWEGEC